MTYDEFVSIMQSDISRILSENSENILRGIIEGLPETTCITEEQLKMCRNAVNISIHFSTELVYHYLCQLGKVVPEGFREFHERPRLQVIEGGLSGKEKG